MRFISTLLCVLLSYLPILPKDVDSLLVRYYAPAVDGVYVQVQQDSSSYSLLVFFAIALIAIIFIYTGFYISHSTER